MSQLAEEVVDAYLDRIGIGERQTTITPDLATLTELMQAHLLAVPFENLDVFHQRAVRTDLDWSVPKVVDQHRGGWCFELNGAFGALLETLGFEVRLLGAAVLLGGPNSTIDHLCLEVTVDEPWLVDVGFGDTFVQPLALNSAAEQDGGNGAYQFIGSPIGATLARIVDGVPSAHYRFKRVAHELPDFDPASDALSSNADGLFRSGPVVTRLLDKAGARITMGTDTLVVKEPDGSERSSIDVVPDDWWPTVERWFGIRGPFDPPDAATR